MFKRNLFSSKKDLHGGNGFQLITINQGKNKLKTKFIKPSLIVERYHEELPYRPDIKTVCSSKLRLLKHYGLKIFVKKKGAYRQDIIIDYNCIDDKYKEVSVLNSGNIYEVDKNNKRIRVITKRIKTKWFNYGKTPKKADGITL